MVYMSGSKMSRNQASIVARPTCGGVKKGGLGPSVGWFLSSNPNLIRVTQTSTQSRFCLYNFNRTIQTQKYGYHASHGGNMG